MKTYAGLHDDQTKTRISMNADQAYNRILEDQFFAYLDAGFPADDTALFRHHTAHIDLAPRLAKEFSLPVQTVDNLLKMAIEEVKLSK